jgi:CRISPR-associated protein Csb2
MLRLDVSLLTGRFVATAHDDRGRAEWPPHPARVFSALVAAHHEAEIPDPLERSALLWLEQQPPPSMEVDRFADIRQVHDVFVPVNDVTLVGDRGAELREAERELAQSTGADLKKARKLVDKERKKLQAFMADQQKAEGETNAKAVATARALMPDKRLRQMRTFPVALPASPHFSLVWEVAPEDSLIAALDRMCAKLTRLGHSSSLVSCRAYVGVAAPTLVPSSSGDVVLRVVGPGQLERLELEFGKHQAVEPRTLPFRPQRYGRPLRPAGAVPSQSVFASEGWILFERSGGSRPLSSRTGDLTRALRAALIERHGPGLSPALSGHDPDGSPTTKPHLAFAALPFVGHEHADGSVQGFAIILPREMAEEDRVNALRLVAAWENANSDELTLGGNFPPMKLRRVDLSSKDALSPIRWTRPARRFITATPIALDRNPGNLRSNFEQTAAKASVHAQRTIADACEQVGLPRPLRVEVSFAPLLRGAQPARAFVPWPQKPGRTARVRVHAELHFDQEVEGPVLIGAGRHFGLGLCLPVSEPRT